MLLVPFLFREDAAHRRWHNVPPELPARSLVRSGWRVRLPWQAGAEVFDLPDLLVLGHEDALAALDPATGRVRWTAPPGALVWPLSGNPQVTDVVEADGRVLALVRGFYTPPGAGIVEFDPVTGRVLLKTSFAGVPDERLQIDGDTVLLAVGDRIEAFDLATGRPVRNPLSNGGWDPFGFRKAFPTLAGTPLCFGRTAFYDGVPVPLGGVPAVGYGDLRAVGPGYVNDADIEDFPLDAGSLAGLCGVRWLRFANPLSGAAEDAWRGAYFGHLSKPERYGGDLGPKRAYVNGVLGIDERGVWTRRMPVGDPEGALARIPFGGGPVWTLLESTGNDALATTAQGYVTIDAKLVRTRNRLGRTLARSPVPAWLRPGMSPASLGHPTRHGVVFVDAEVAPGGGVRALNVGLVPY